MSTNTINSFSGLWMPTEYRNIETDKVSISTIQSGWLSPRWGEDEPASLRNLWRSLPPLPAASSSKSLADEFYYLDPYSGGGSSIIHACRTGCNAGEVLNPYNSAPKTPMGSL